MKKGDPDKKPDDHPDVNLDANQFDYIGMRFIELDPFTKDVGGILSDFEYAKLQRTLTRNPEVGDLVRETGGARKIRVGLAGSGKRGGARVVYYYQAKHTIHLLLIYRKKVQEVSTPEEIRMVRKAIGLIKEGWL